MSLINDALKRAKEVQKDATPAAGPEPEFRPVNPEEEDSLKVIPPLIIAALAIVALVLLWRSFQGEGARAQTETIVSARSPEVSTPAPEPPAPTLDPELVAAATHTEASTPTTAVATTPQHTQAPVPAVTQVAPALPRLQAVVFVPKRPSAIIDGRTVFLGDKLGTYKVSAITRTNVILFSGKERLTLNLH